MRYAIRPMRIEDIPQANDIDRECFPTQWPPLSYKREIISNKLAHYFVVCDSEEKGNVERQGAAPVEQTVAARRSSSLSRFVGKMRQRFGGEQFALSATAQRVLGLAGVWMMADEAHLTTIGVREAYRRRGIGELLLTAAIGLATLHSAEVLTLEVRASNHTAITLYEKYGFSRLGIRRGYYQEDGEDAVIMSTDKLTSPSFQRRLQQLKQAQLQRLGPVDCHID